MIRIKDVYGYSTVFFSFTKQVSLSSDNPLKGEIPFSTINAASGSLIFESMQAKTT